MIGYGKHHSYIVFFTALIINLFFIIVTNRCNFFPVLVVHHGEVAYNLWRYNSIQINPDRLTTLEKAQETEARLIDYKEINHEMYAAPSLFRNLNDTLAYGIFLGLLWKITNSLCYKDIQILQVIVFSLLMLLIYRIALLLFQNSLCALLSTLSCTLCFPLIFLNVHPLRDIWAFYGLVILLYAFLKKHYDSLSYIQSTLLAILFTLCQWMRPPIFITLLGLIPFFLYHNRALLRTCTVFLAINCIFFWLPYCWYNKYAHGSLSASSNGLLLYHGLGEFPNPWNLPFSDNLTRDLLQEKYGKHLLYGYKPYQDKAYELFIAAVKEHPFAYFKQLLRRLPSLIIFCVTLLHNTHEFNHTISGNFLVKIITQSMSLLTIFQKKIYYGRLYLLLGWLGIIVLWYRRNYFTANLLVLTALSSAAILPSHLEPRYLITNYAFFGLAIGFLVYSIMIAIKKYYNRLYHHAYATRSS